MSYDDNVYWCKQCNTWHPCDMPDIHTFSVYNYDFDFDKMVKKLSKPVKVIGIDVDTHDKKIIDGVIVRCKQFGTLRNKFRTKHGWHFSIQLENPVMLARSFEIRYYIGDDMHRLVRDMLKANRGFKTIDVLFDLKKLHNKSVLEL